MSQIDSLPPYDLAISETNLHVSPAPYNTVPPPSFTDIIPTYRIGSWTLDSPLVSVQQLKAHLTLLRAFKNLRLAVEGEGSRLPLACSVPLRGAQRWAWFVNLAVERFQRWAAAVQVKDLHHWLAEELPPLDVLMVWHAYMLNPTWYAEDCERLPLLRLLRVMRDKLLPAVMSMGDNPAYQPSEAREDSWLAQTDTPFDPLDAAACMFSRTIECPECCTSIETPYLNQEGTGYTQHNFKQKCSKCEHEITKASLGTAKFVKDLMTNRSQTSAAKVYLAGTLHTPTNAKDTSRATRFRNGLLRLRQFQQYGLSKEGWKREIQHQLRHSMKTLYDIASPHLEQPASRHLLDRIVSAYTDDRPFSVDLVGAVLRQGAFIDKMHEFGWTRPGFFDNREDEHVLEHAIARYHAFLDLMATSEEPLMLVPTLDIDLAWHSHQLKAGQYELDCKQYVGRYIDHDDKVAQDYLASSLDTTCRAWQKRYGVPYMYCGCLLPEESITERLRRFKHSMKEKPLSLPNLDPPNNRHAIQATHPSEHNSVVVQASSIGIQKPDAQPCSRPKHRKWHARYFSDDRSQRHRQAHEPAFLTPIPFYRPASACVTAGGSFGFDAGAAAPCAIGGGVCHADAYGLVIDDVLCISS